MGKSLHKLCETGSGSAVLASFSGDHAGTSVCSHQLSRCPGLILVKDRFSIGPKSHAIQMLDAIILAHTISRLLSLPECSIMRRRPVSQPAWPSRCSEAADDEWAVSLSTASVAGVPASLPAALWTSQGGIQLSKVAQRTGSRRCEQALCHKRCKGNAIKPYISQATAVLTCQSMFPEQACAVHVIWFA